MSDMREVVIKRWCEMRRGPPLRLDIDHADAALAAIREELAKMVPHFSPSDVPEGHFIRPVSPDKIAHNACRAAVLALLGGET